MAEPVPNLDPYRQLDDLQAGMASHAKPEMPLDELEWAIQEQLMSPHPPVDLEYIAPSQKERVVRTIAHVLDSHVDEIVTNPVSGFARRPHRVVGEADFGVNELIRELGHGLGAPDTDSVVHENTEETKRHYMHYAASLSRVIFYPAVSLATGLGRKWHAEGNTEAFSCAEFVLASYGVRMQSVPIGKRPDIPPHKTHDPRFQTNV